MSEEIMLQIENTILRLENSVQNQTQLGSDVKTLLINELNSLPNIPISNIKKAKQQFKKSHNE